MGDQLLFSAHSNRIISETRRDFLNQILSAPPMVFVVTNYRFGDTQTFDKLNEWPEFPYFLRHNYTLVTERTFGYPSQKEEPLGYCIYSHIRLAGRIVPRKLELKAGVYQMSISEKRRLFDAEFGLISPCSSSV